MGLSNSAQSWQRLIDHILAGMDNVFAYLDDLLIYSKTEAEHKATLDSLFKKLSAAGLALSVSKCQFGVSELDYLGYRVSAYHFCLQVHNFFNSEKN